MTSDAAAKVIADFTAFSATTRRRAPLYSSISARIADAPLLLNLMLSAPETARVPVNLFAAVHDLLLADRSDRLARFYPNLTRHPDGGDPMPEFLAFCSARTPQLRASLATRFPQTNEIGRSALFLAGFDHLAAGPKAHLDLGASAGLNLMVDKLAYRSGDGRVLGDSDVILDCSVRGEPSGLAERLPDIRARLGLDIAPVDPSDAAGLRWLKACVWPDQADRFHRLEAAIALLERNPVEVRRGDIVDDLGEAVAAVADRGHPVVTTSWVLCYLESERQLSWLAELERIAAGLDLSWVWAEAPAQVGVLPVAPQLAASHTTILGVSTWRDGVRFDRTLGRCHQHGYWLHRL
ncbi:MAG TPA: DUF2332 domain-containing protein [Propionicimonas sp.]|uniref:DUF2332 domain-containing protein n=1 Tax=Propionicimonas sp. TaxID=1955623 RepID=UPI002F3EF3E6